MEDWLDDIGTSLERLLNDGMTSEWQKDFEWWDDIGLSLEWLQNDRMTLELKNDFRITEWL